MKTLIIVLAGCLATVYVNTIQAQDKAYWVSASEFIFSGGDVEATTGGLYPVGIDVNPIVRFSGFFHFQSQFHADFNKSIGIYTGVGIRNVGMINELNDSLKVKQRVYSLGVPLALKIGSMPNRFYVALGGEAELFFHYKQKIFYDDEKFKQNEWFSDKVNLFNPSVFMDIHFNKGAYIKFKYYLFDFLQEDNQNIRFDGKVFDYYPSESKMFYVSIGTTMRSMSPKSKRKKVVSPVNTTGAY